MPTLATAAASMPRMFAPVMGRVPGVVVVEPLPGGVLPAGDVGMTWVPGGVLPPGGVVMQLCWHGGGVWQLCSHGGGVLQLCWHGGGVMQLCSHGGGVWQLCSHGGWQSCVHVMMTVECEPPVQPELAKPSRPSEMLHRLTGTLTGALTVLPDRIENWPELPLPPLFPPLPMIVVECEPPLQPE